MIVSLGSDSGQSVYAVFIDDSTSKYWNGSAMEAFNSAHWSSYAVAAAETGSTGRYTVTVPSGMSSGTFQVFFYAGSPATVGDAFLGAKSITVPTATVTVSATGNIVAAYTAQLNAIDTQINAMINNPRPNYKVGNTSMDYADLFEKLYAIRDKILFKLQSLQGESYETINTDINQFGQDIADYVNEASE